jgi:hypothetical protein
MKVMASHDQQELDDLRLRLIERADSNPDTPAYVKHEFDLAYNSGDLELLYAFDALFVPGAVMETTREYVAQLRHTGLNAPLDEYFTPEHKIAFTKTVYALQRSSGSRVFNHMTGFEVFETQIHILPVLRAVLEHPECHEQIVSLIRIRGIKDPSALIDLYREMSAKPRAISDGTL